LSGWSGLGDDDRVVVAVRDYVATSKDGLIDLLYPVDDWPVGALLELPDDLSPEELQTLQRLKAIPAWLEVRLAQPLDLLSLIGATAQIDESERPLFDAIVTTVGAVPPDPAVSRLEQLRSLLVELRDRHRKLRGTHEDHEIHIDPGTLTI